MGNGHGGARKGSGRKAGKLSAGKMRIAEMAREYAEVALQTLVEISQSGITESARVTASNSILERAFGKSPQAMHLSGPNGGPIETINHDLSKLSEDELSVLHNIVAKSVTDPDRDGQESVH